MANANNFPLLNGMSLYSLRLESGGVREPHWHPNAAELSYCLAGRALMTIFGPGAGHDTFTVDTGEIVFVPKAIFITSRISVTKKLNLQLLLIMRGQKILEYLGQLVRCLTTYWEPRLDLDLNILVISRNLVKIY